MNTAPKPSEAARMSTPALDATTLWWRDHARDAMGARYAEKTVESGSEWDAVVASGRADLMRALVEVGFRTGPDLDAVEIACGLARLTVHLGDHYRSVLGLDISPQVVAEATRLCQAANVTFAVSSGYDILPDARDRYDVVLCAETFHHLSPKLVHDYCQDALRILKPGGQLAVHVNVDQPRPLTRVARVVRTVMHRLGVATWRGFPTDPGFARQYHRSDWVVRTLNELGFDNVRRKVESDRQAWFLAEKPGR
jgi:SAM-dependent methyltransferase